MRRPALPRFRPAAPLALMLALYGCGAEWKPSSPYDPAMPLTIRITGPDTLFSFADTLQFDAETTPAWSAEWPSKVVTWKSSDLLSLGEGRFVAIPVTADGPKRVTAQIGDRIDTAFVFLRRRAARLRAFTCADTRDSATLATNGVMSVCAMFYGRDGYPVTPSAAPAPATAFPADPSLVSVGAQPTNVNGNVLEFVARGLREGSTWVRITGGVTDAGLPIADSVQVTVRQKVVGGTVTPCGAFAVGDSVILAVDWLDGGGRPMALGPATVRWSIVSQTYQGVPADSVAAVTPNGLLTTIRPGTFTVSVHGIWPDNWNYAADASCEGWIVGSGPDRP